MTFDGNSYAKEQYEKYLKKSFEQSRPLTFAEAKDRRIDVDALIMVFGNFMELTKQTRADFKHLKITAATGQAEEEQNSEVELEASEVAKPQRLATGKYAQRRRERRQIGDRRVKWSEESLRVALEELYEYFGGRPSQQQVRELSKLKKMPSWTTLINEFGPPREWDKIVS